MLDIDGIFIWFYLTDNKAKSFLLLILWLFEIRSNVISSQHNQNPFFLLYSFDQLSLELHLKHTVWFRD